MSHKWKVGDWARRIDGPWGSFKEGETFQVVQVSSDNHLRDKCGALHNGESVEPASIRIPAEQLQVGDKFWLGERMVKVTKVVPDTGWFETGEDRYGWWTDNTNSLFPDGIPVLREAKKEYPPEVEDLVQAATVTHAILKLADKPAAADALGKALEPFKEVK